MSLKIESENPGDCKCRQTYRVVDPRTGQVLASKVKSYDQATQIRRLIEQGR